MKNILVTGSEGMIGKELVTLLSLGKGQSNENVRILKADLKLGDDLIHFSTCLRLCKDIDEVYNLAGIKGSPKRTSERPADFFAPMIQFNTNMLEAARINNVKKFLYVSSIAVEHPETDEYPAWAKLTGEKQIETYRIQYPKGMQCCIVRPANVYGRYDNFNNEYAMVITALVKKALDIHTPILWVWGDGSQVRDFVNAKDVARGMIKCMHFMPTIPINLCSGKGVTIKRLAEIIAKEVKKTVKYDTTKPIGAKSRVMKLNGDFINWEPTTNIEQGIKDIFKELK